MRSAALSISLLLALGACAADTKETSVASLQKISDIRSGELTLDVAVSPSGEGEATGFSLEGVFSLPEEAGEIPEADLVYTQRAGGSEADGRFIANGETVFVEVHGDRSELPPEEVDSFRVAGTDAEGSVFSALQVDEWFPEPVIEESGEEIVMSGELDVVAALNDIFEVARSFGGSLEPIGGPEADIVRDSVREARAEIVTGAEDGLLRHVEVELDLGVADAELAKVLGPLAGATFTLDFTISSVNQPVDVE